MTSWEHHPQLENLLEYIRRNRGFDLGGYKRASLSRRVHKRMQTLGIQSYDEYIDYLEVHPDEFVELFNTILINVTTFFREPLAWDYITNEIIPSILTRKQGSKPIRIWSAGCASGEETYTIAMLLAEALGMKQYSERVKIFATDVDVHALKQARHGSYSAKDIQGIPDNLLDKYFEKLNNRWVVQKQLRRCAIFGRHDLVQDAPISRIDLLVCRNTLMYFNTETQSKIIDRFQFALNDSGFLFLGKAEMLFSRNHSFTPIDLKRRVFVKTANGNLRDMLLNMANSHSQQTVPEMTEQIRIHEAALDIDPVAQIVVDLHNSVLLANFQARIMFNLNPKDLGRRLQDLELSYRPVELRSRIDQVRSTLRSMTLKDIEWSNAEREMRYLDVQIIPLLDENVDKLLGIKIIFTDVTRFKQLQNELVYANQELETAYEELQSTNEELETTNEELQSTVEELETTNEELQSTNEELETMNEELESTNEELQTINEEFRQRSDELNRINGFLESILSSLRVGVVVINASMQILIWNRKAEDLWGLRFDEVFLRHFMSLDIGLPLEALRQPLAAIIDGKSEHYEALIDARNRRGKAIACQLTCTSLVRMADIQGVILLMEEEDKDQKNNYSGNVLQ